MSHIYIEKEMLENIFVNSRITFQVSLSQCITENLPIDYEIYSNILSV